MPSLQLPERFRNSPFDSDYYKIMRVARTANANEINQAFKQRALEYHPDHAAQNNLTIEEATLCMQALVEIKSMLLLNCMCMDDQARRAPREKLFSPEEELAALMLKYARSARFCDYRDNTGPGVPGYWCLISGGRQNVEIGTSRFSKKTAIANDQCHVEVSGPKFSSPLAVYCKSSQPFSKIYDPEKRQAALQTLAQCIPAEQRKNALEIYGEYVAQKPAVMASQGGMFLAGRPAASPGEFRIADSSGDNFATGVCLSKDEDGYIISGRNGAGQQRFIQVHADGSITGFNGHELGYAEAQLARFKDSILLHFKFEPAAAFAPKHI